MAKKFVGTVVSDVQDKTIVVAVTRRVTHSMYGKKYTVTKKLAGHDEKNEAKKGDRVELTETSPISKRKKFTLVRVLEASHGEIQLKEDAPEVLPQAEDKKEEKK